MSKTPSYNMDAIEQCVNNLTSQLQALQASQQELKSALEGMRQTSTENHNTTLEYITVQIKPEDIVPTVTLVEPVLLAPTVIALEETMKPLQESITKPVEVKPESVEFFPDDGSFVSYDFV